MFSALRVRNPQFIIFLACVLLSLTTASARSDLKPLSKEEQAKVDRAIERGVDYFRKMQSEEGDWPKAAYVKTNMLGKCLLAAYALLEAGVPAQDPMIQKAADFIRPRVLKSDQTYDLSLAVLFLDRLGDPKDESLIRSLALRLIAGQHRSGGWNYRCPTMKKEHEENLFNLLEELCKRHDEGEKSAAQALRNLRISGPLRALTVFHDPRKLTWQDPTPSHKNQFSVFFTGTTDNSNTQFAILGLWAARRHGIPVNPTFRLVITRFERSQHAEGWWPYVRPSDGRGRPSMTCVGLLGLAIGSGLKEQTRAMSPPIARELCIIKGLARLSQDIGAAAGQLDKTRMHRGTYYLWSVERVGMLYNLPTIGDKDWYSWGVKILLDSQKPGGEWEVVSVSAQDWPTNFGPAVNTALALLFLKHSHPMKDLTPKLPFTAKELNESIARLNKEGSPPPGSTAQPSRSRSLEMTTRPSSESRKNPP